MGLRRVAAERACAAQFFFFFFNNHFQEQFKAGIEITEGIIAHQVPPESKSLIKFLESRHFTGKASDNGSPAPGNTAGGSQSPLCRGRGSSRVSPSLSTVKVEIVRVTVDNTFARAWQPRPAAWCWYKKPVGGASIRGECKGFVCMCSVCVQGEWWTVCREGG